MSALTASPSPAASPRATGLSQFAALHRASQSPSNHHLTSSNSRPRSIDCSPHYSPHLRPAPRPQTRPQYADAGVQCSREGFSPVVQGGVTSNGPPMGHKRKGSSSPSMRAATETSGAPEEASAKDGSSDKVSQYSAPTQPQASGLTQKLAASQVSADPDVPNATAAAKRMRTGAATAKVVPQRYEKCDPKDLGVLIANMLMELIRLNDPIPLKDGKLTRFHSRAPPGISCHDYLLRLIQHATLSPPILLSMVFYIDRLCAMYGSFTISSLTVHRFLITAATVASKGLSDSFWTNPTYARIGGISTGELATLEMDFLQKMEWRIVPKPETLTDYYRSLVQRSEGYELEPESEDEDVSDNMDDDSP